VPPDRQEDAGDLLAVIAAAGRPAVRLCAQSADTSLEPPYTAFFGPLVCGAVSGRTQLTTIAMVESRIERGDKIKTDMTPLQCCEEVTNEPAIT
jgi:hypothetical protein